MTITTFKARTLTDELAQVHSLLAHSHYDPHQARRQYDLSHAVSVARWYIAEAEPAADLKPTQLAVDTYRWLSEVMDHQLNVIIVNTGLNVYWTRDDPFGSSIEMIETVNETRILKVFKSDDSHPIWTPNQNDTFRAVHDCLGHVAWRNSFSMTGEDAAFRSHAATVPLEVLPALASETRGQNATFNHGPNIDNRPQNTYARQSWLLSPKWVYDWNL